MNDEAVCRTAPATPVDKNPPNIFQTMHKGNVSIISWNTNLVENNNKSTTFTFP